MLLYMINDPEETSISKQTFVNPMYSVPYIEPHRLYQEGERGKDGSSKRGLASSFVATDLGLPRYRYRQTCRRTVPPEDPIPRLPGTDRRETLAFWSPTSGQYTMHQT